jgi:hypothetical protein
MGFTQNLLGDPQKAPPCGEESGSTATGNVTTYVAGQTITITVNETIYHPGHYRVALGLTGPQDLPPEPVVTPDTTACGSVPIETSPTFPVLADGQLIHTAALGGSKSFQVTCSSSCRTTPSTFRAAATTTTARPSTWWRPTVECCPGPNSLRPRAARATAAGRVNWCSRCCC